MMSPAGITLTVIGSVFGFVCTIAVATFAHFRRLENSDAKSFLARTYVPPVRFWQWRLVADIIPQAINKMPRCPESTVLAGQLILLTGATSGIGYETAKGLARRGADLIIASRNEEKGAKVAAKLIAENNVCVQFMKLDLSDMGSVSNFVSNLDKTRKGRQVDQLIQNAGYAPMKYSESKQGYEIAFAINVLGPQLLLELLLKKNILRQDAKVIVVHGDIYSILSGSKNAGCTSDYEYRGRQGSPMVAYSRSKLGVHWLFNRSRRRHQELHLNLVHPGVISSGLGGNEFEPNCILRRLLLNSKVGAQTTLICATSDTINGAYYHNTLGRMLLRPDDIANNKESEEELWRAVEELMRPYL